MMLEVARRFLPAPARRWLWQRWSRSVPGWPPPGWVRFGSLRRLTPISRRFGYDRGQPIDRYFIERFLAQQAADIQGRVLEIGDDAYTRQWGNGRVRQSDVWHVSADNPKATIVGDLAKADHVESEQFDCIICTQTLHLIYDVQEAIGTLHRLLRPGGVLLATVPGLSQIDYGLWEETWYWGFTGRSAERLFGEQFAAGNLMVCSRGNVLSATAFLQGLAVRELRPAELEYHDPHYVVVVTVRAVKEGGEAGR
jgi:SAM-dependent methyltransferase